MDLVKFDEEECETEEITNMKNSEEYKNKLLSEKRKIIEYFLKGMKLAESIN